MVDKISAQILVEIISRHGIRQVFCSPGSRNAPLLLAFDEHHELTKHVVIDERTAAFMALGMAKTMQKPVALVCTSGTALLNYAPAVAEAYYSRVPMIVISADRPIQWIDQDDSQTLRQFEAFSNFIIKSYDIPEINRNDSIMISYANRVVNDAVMMSTGRRPGPVHINVQFDNPLTSQTSLPLPNNASRLIQRIEGDPTLPSETMDKLCGEIENAKVLLIAGFMPPSHSINRAVAMLMKCPNVYVMHETISNLHLPGDHHMIDSLLCTMSDEEKCRLKPDIVISIGGALVSRFIKEYLRKAKPAQHWTIGYQNTTVDCFLSLTKRIEADPARILRKLANHILHKRIESDYALKWEKIKCKAKERNRQYVADAPWSDLKACHMLLANLPENYNLHLSNGTPIRYAQILQWKQPHVCFCNRGVSGIDGCTSTALGASLAYDKPTLLLSGDMSFSYDIGALAQRSMSSRFKMVVLNNRGGGIFRFIPSTRDLSKREEYFGAPPVLPLEELSKAYSIKYLRAENEVEMTVALEKLYSECASPTILEVVTPPEQSAEILKGFLLDNNETKKNNNNI